MGALMYPTTILEWWHKGAWHEIGWRASNPKSAADLREHAEKMASGGGHYRIVTPSVYADAPPEVVWTSAAFERTRAVSAVETWDEYHRAMSSLTAEMIGAANYFDEHAEYATDERLAQTFRDYAARMRAVPVPGRVGAAS